MAKEIVDDVFFDYEKIQTKSVATITEQNIGHLAKLLKGIVDHTGDTPKLILEPDSTYPKEFNVGDRVTSRGYRDTGNMDREGWRPAGSYRLTDINN